MTPLRCPQLSPDFPSGTMIESNKTLWTPLLFPTFKGWTCHQPHFVPCFYYTSACDRRGREFSGNSADFAREPAVGAADNAVRSGANVRIAAKLPPSFFPEATQVPPQTPFFPVNWRGWPERDEQPGR